MPPTEISTGEEEEPDEDSEGEEDGDQEDVAGSRSAASRNTSPSAPAVSPSPSLESDRPEWPVNIGCGGLYAAIDSTSHQRVVKEETVINIGGYVGALVKAELGGLVELFDGRSGPRSELREVLKML